MPEINEAILISPETIKSEVEMAMRRRVAFHASEGSQGDGSLNILVLADGFGVAVRVKAADRSLSLEQFCGLHVRPLAEAWRAYKAQHSRE